MGLGRNCHKAKNEVEVRGPRLVAGEGVDGLHELGRQKLAEEGALGRQHKFERLTRYGLWRRTATGGACRSSIFVRPWTPQLYRACITAAGVKTLGVKQRADIEASGANKLRMHWDRHDILIGFALPGDSRGRSIAQGARPLKLGAASKVPPDLSQGRVRQNTVSVCPDPAQSGRRQEYGGTKRSARSGHGDEAHEGRQQRGCRQRRQGTKAAAAAAIGRPDLGPRQRRPAGAARAAPTCIQDRFKTPLFDIGCYSE